MTSSRDSWLPRRRRTLLRTVAGASTAVGIQRALAARATGSSIVMEQGDRCVELEPLTGDQPVEDLYDYTYPKDEWGGPPGSQGVGQSSMGTIDLQRERTSVLFLYDGPEGLSLVIVHGKVENDAAVGPDEKGGMVTFTIRGLPDDGSWFVKDDYYFKPEVGPQVNYARDTWDVDGEPHVIDWAYFGHRTDGGVFRGLGSSFEVAIEPAFNDEATLAAEVDYGPIEAWEALSGDRENPERFPLRLDRPVTIRTGTCETGDGGQDGDQEEHEDAQRKKDRKHQQKHEKKQRKHQRKHEKKQRKHQQKHEKKQRKHEKDEKKRGKHGRKKGKGEGRGKHGRKRRKHGGKGRDD